MPPLSSIDAVVGMDRWVGETSQLCLVSKLTERQLPNPVGRWVA